MTNVLQLPISKTELENRIHAALEQATKSPIVKKRNQMVNAAMVTILHGGNGAGQNEHNLDQFFVKNNSRESIVNTLKEKGYLSKNGHPTEKAKELVKQEPDLWTANVRISVKDGEPETLIEFDPTDRDTLEERIYREILMHVENNIPFINVEDMAYHFDALDCDNYPQMWIIKEFGSIEEFYLSDDSKLNSFYNYAYYDIPVEAQPNIIQFFIESNIAKIKIERNIYKSQEDELKEMREELNIYTGAKVFSGTENYTYGDKNYDENVEQFSGATEESVLRQIYNSITSYLGEFVWTDFTMAELDEFLNMFGYSLTEEELALEGEEIMVWLKASDALELEKQKLVVDFLGGLDQVYGEYNCQEISLKDVFNETKLFEADGYKKDLRIPENPQYHKFNHKKENVEVDELFKPKKLHTKNETEEKTVEMTIYTTLIEHHEFNEEGTGMILEDVSVFNDLDEEEHTERLKQSFFLYCPDNDSIVSELLEISVIEEAMNEKGVVFDSDVALDKLLDWIVENVEQHEYIDLIENLTMGMTKIDVQYATKTVKIK